MKEAKEQTALQQLQELAKATKKDRYGNVPAYAIVDPKFNDLTANNLTTCIVTWLTLNGHYCSRIQSQGQWRGSIQRFTKSTVRKGIGDVMATIDGKMVMIEIKIGRDKLSQAQIKTKEDVEKSGGLYWVVKTFDDFMNEYKLLTKQITI